MKYVKPEMEEVLLNLRDGIMIDQSIVIKKEGEIDDSSKILAPERRRGNAEVWQEW